MFDRSTRILVVIDSSNFEYVCINNAVSNWERDNSDESSTVLKEARETDQDNLPNLLNYNSFKRKLSESVQRKFDYLKQIVRDNHRDCVDCASGVDFVFVLDGKLSDNFRKKAYPQYKAQRKTQKKRYDPFVLKDYIQNVIFEEIGIERAGCRVVRENSCECDDIVAVIMEKYPDYMLRVLFSSDRDFLQLKDVEQYNCWGERVSRTVPGVDGVVLSRSDFILWKTIRGDVSDNIPPDPLLLSSAFISSWEAGGVFVMNVKDLSAKIVITTGIT